MESPGSQHTPPYKLFKAGPDGLTVHFFNGLDASNASPIIKELLPALESKVPRELTVDLEKVTHLDDLGALVILELRRIIAKGGGDFHLKNASEKVNRTLTSLDFAELGQEQPDEKKQLPNIFIRFGEATLGPLPEIKFLISFIGSIVPTSLLACMMDTSTVSCRILLRTSSGSTMPCLSTGTRVDSKPHFSSVFTECSTEKCSIA